MKMKTDYNDFHRQNVRKLCEKWEVAYDKIDFEAIWDSGITIQENYRKITEKVKRSSDLKDLPEMEQIISMEKKSQEWNESQILQNIDGEPTFKDTGEAIEEICNYTYKGEVFTFSTLLSLVDNQSVINRSICGAGKSRSSKELLEYLEIPKTIIKSGHLTAKKFFRTIQQYSDFTIVFDEADILLSNRKIKQMIKSLLTASECSWESDNGSETAELQGSIILNCNDYTFSQGIEDKVIANTVTLSTKEFKEKIEQGRNYEPTDRVWDKVRERIVYARHNEIELTEKEEDTIYEFVLELPTISSYRIKSRIFSIFRGLKAIFGTLETEVFRLGKRLSKQMIPQDQIAKILVGEEEVMERKELAEKIANSEGISKRQAYRKINKLVEEDYLEETGTKKRVAKKV